MWTVYIIKSDCKKWYYVGSTNDLNRRLREHNNGFSSATKPYKPFKVIYTKSFSIEKDARDYEWKLKKCRIEKEKIIKDFENHSEIV